MKTYQDLLIAKEPNDSSVLQSWVYSAIQSHKDSKLYRQAVIANDYAERRNTTIVEYQKLLYTVSGQAVPDNYSANYKLCHNFFQRFLTQLTQFLLGNGISWNEDSTADKLGDDFDNKVQDAGYKALEDRVAFGFWNNDHLEVFSVREFVPLYDENNGALMAGIRFWQIDASKPLRGTLYEIDGYTTYEWNLRLNDDGDEIELVTSIVEEKQTYKREKVSNPVDGERIYNLENYESFPIVPLWGNKEKKSELTGRREQIDAYDLIKSGFANDLDDCSQIYWTISNAGGMDDMDLVKFIEHMKTVKAAIVDDQGQAQSHTIDVPYASREALLDRLRSDLYDDFMMLDTKSIAGGAITATQIESSYEPLNEKADDFEYQVVQFIKGILKLAGIDDKPTFTRSYIINVEETVQVLLQASQYLPQEYVTKKIVTLLGDIDKLDDIKAQMAGEVLDRYGLNAPENGQGTGETGEEDTEGVQ